MTVLERLSRHRALLISFGFVLALVTLGFVFRKPLTAWVTGKSIERAGEVVGARTLGSAVSDGGPAGSAIDHYTCSMHPSVNQAGPGKCPICGMDLIPVTKEQQAEGVVLIDEGRRQLIGVRTAPVIEGPMQTGFRAVGRITYDESGLADVTLKVSGYIARLAVNETGQRVKRGQTLFSLYSPELYNAEKDFLLATRGDRTSSFADGGARGDSFAHAARTRLRLLGMSKGQIDAIAKKGEALENVPIGSPADGFVIEKNVFEGGAVEAGQRLYRIAALKKVWVEAEIYEQDLARVHVDQPAKVTLDYLPGRAYEAKVAYVYPYLETAARTGKVRIELANKELDLRPGMYASVELGSDLGARIQVPVSAIVYTGPRRLVFVDLGEGRFRPQEVRVGTEANGMYEVLDGLKAGDIVATSGVFLIAAEARISTAAKYWDSTTETPDAGGTTKPAPLPSPPASGHAAPKSAPAKGATTKREKPPPASDFTCPMHPAVSKKTPGTCPKCGMNLVPRKGAP